MQRVALGGNSDYKGINDALPSLTSFQSRTGDIIGESDDG